MEARCAAHDCRVFEMLEQNLARCRVPCPAIVHGEQKQFGLVRDEPRQGEAERPRPRRRASVSQTPGNGSRPAHCGRGPGLAEARVEAVVHHRHHVVQVG